VSVLAVCDGCGWTTPVENTGDVGVPKHWNEAHAATWADIVPVGESLLPSGPPPVPIRDCACPICYRGRWKHSVKPEDFPPLIFYVVGRAEPRQWYDTCPRCTIPDGYVQGAPISWRLLRFAFILASIVTAVWMWTRIVLFGLGIS